MSNPKCTVCGHINRVGVLRCEECDTLLAPTQDARRAETKQRASADGTLPTEIPAPHFKGAGDVFSATLDIYRRHFPLVGLLVLATTLPLVLVQYGTASLLGGLAAETASGMSGAVPFIFVAGLFAGLLAIIARSVLEGSLIYGIIEVQRTGTARVGECLRWGVRKMLRVILANIFLTVVVGVGFLCFIVPGIILWLMYALVVPAVVVEGRSVGDAISRSVELTKGYRGLIFLTFFLWWLMVMVVSLIIGGSFALAGGENSFVVTLLQTLLNETLGTTTIVLGVYIFLGILKERRHEPGRDAFTPSPSGEYAAR